MEKEKNAIVKKNSWPKWPFFSEKEMSAVRNVLASGNVNYWTGDECHLFEQEYAKALGINYAIAMMNGTVALEAALVAIGIGAGDEVITTCRTFIASASPIVMLGAKPVFADVDEVTQNITADSIAKVISSRTKAIVAVHIAGWPCDMPAIMALAKKHGLFVIEDCAQAHGARFDNRPMGAWGDIAAFSFCQDKIITTGGEGGMVTTQDETFFKKMWSYKDHGKCYDTVYKKNHAPGFRWLHKSFGSNWRMTEMQAAIGRIQLTYLPEWIRQRQRNAQILTNAFVSLPALRTTIPPENISHAYYKYYVFVNDKELKPGWNRDRIMQEIVAEGVPCFAGICSEIYLEDAFAARNLQPLARLPLAKKLGETALVFLVHPTLTEKDMTKMANKISEVVLGASYEEKIA